MKINFNKLAEVVRENVEEVQGCVSKSEVTVGRIGDKLVTLSIYSPGEAEDEQIPALHENSHCINSPVGFDPIKFKTRLEARISQLTGEKKSLEAKLERAKKDFKELTEAHLAHTKSLDDLMSDSSGVSGYHQNDDIASWDEIHSAFFEDCALNKDLSNRVKYSIIRDFVAEQRPKVLTSAGGTMISSVPIDVLIDNSAKLLKDCP